MRSSLVKAATSAEEKIRKTIANLKASLESSRLINEQYINFIVIE